jgi:hypothetical protein
MRRLFGNPLTRIRSLGRKLNEAIVEIGRELIAAKKRWPRQFTAWLEVELRMNPRTALNYMHLADWGADKSEIVSVLSLASLYKLAAPSTPAVASDEVVSRIRSGEIGVIGKVLDIVSAAKDARKSPTRRGAGSVQSQSHSRAAESRNAARETTREEGPAGKSGTRAQETRPEPAVRAGRRFSP